MLEIRDLHFSYGGREILSGVRLKAGDGELIFILGGNGAGKTTLFRCVLGLLRPAAGQILLDGRDVSKIPPRTLASQIAYIPQTHNPTFSFSVLDMVLMGTSHRLSLFAEPGRAEREIAMGVLKQLGLEAFAARDFHRLSGGEQQLVLVARALAQQAKVLLMDEPTASLDYGNQHLVLERISGLAQQGYTVLLSCHNPQLAMLYATRIAALHGGAVIADGAPETALDPALMARLYGVSTRFCVTPNGTLISPIRKSLSCWRPDMIRFMRDADRVNRFHALLAQSLLPLLPLGGSFCDAGCGIGSLAKAMAPHFQQVVAADISPDALNILREGPLPENLEVRQCDIFSARQSPPFDVMAFCFFGSFEEILKTAPRLCCGKVVIVTRTWETHRFSLSRKMEKPRYGAAHLRECLDSRQIPYVRRRLRMDMGQPFRTVEDAAQFFRLYSHDENAAAITAADVQDRLIRREDPEFPWYLPQECEVEVFLLSASDLKGGPEPLLNNEKNEKEKTV